MKIALGLLAGLALAFVFIWILIRAVASAVPDELRRGQDRRK